MYKQVTIRSLESISGIGLHILSGLLRNWKARRQLRKMLDFDERQLSDIGVTRDEIAWALRLPLRVNAAQELSHRSARRRHADRIAGNWS